MMSPTVTQSLIGWLGFDQRSSKTCPRERAFKGRVDVRKQRCRVRVSVAEDQRRLELRLIPEAH